MTRSAFRLAAMVASLAVVTALTGCTDEDDDPSARTPPQPAPSPSVTSTASESTSPATVSPTARTTSNSAPVPRCTLDDLTVTVGAGGGAAGTEYNPIVLENISSSPCRITGFGGVSYVDASGHQVGAAALHDSGSDRRELLVEPGGHASQILREAEAQSFPRSRCRPTEVDGVKIFPPDETHFVVVDHPTTGCANRHLRTLSLAGYGPGATRH